MNRLLDLLRTHSRPEVIDHGHTLRAGGLSGEAERVISDLYRTLVTTGAQPTTLECTPAMANDAVVNVASQLRLDVVTNEAAETFTMHATLDDPSRHTSMALSNDGDLVYLLGELRGDLDFARELLLGQIMIAASRDGLLNGAYCITDAGFVVALAEMAIAGEKGARFWLPDGVDEETALFGTAPGRIICVVPRTEELRFSDMCVARYVPLTRVGVVDGEVLELQDHFKIPVAELTQALLQ